MKQIIQFLKTHWFGVSIILILLLASGLRFYDYNNRYGLATDQAHDALVSRAALRNHVLPPVGPFSSAGPFVMGPEWYYFIMVATAIYPFSPITPWIVLTLTYIFFVYIMILIGKEIAGKQLGLIVGLLSAVSTVQISQAINLTNQAPISVLCAIAIWGVLKYLHTKKERYFFLACFCIGVAVNTHLQGVLLLPFVFLTFFFQRLSIKGFFFSIIALCIPFIPLFIFDFTHDHFELKNMLQYYLHDQYRINLDQFGRRWSTYLIKFWPVAIAEMIGGFSVVSYVTIVVTIGFCIYAILKKHITKFAIILAITVAIGVIFLRYTHTPLFYSYLMFTNPFIFIIVGWTIYQVMQQQRVLGVIFLLILCAGSFLVDMKQLKHSENYTAFQAHQWKNVLLKKYPNEKFDLYDFQYKTSLQSLALSLFLDADNKIDNHGRKIGVVVFTLKFKYPFYQQLLGPQLGYQLFDLSSSSSAQLSHAGWASVTPRGIYASAEEWYKK